MSDFTLTSEQFADFWIENQAEQKMGIEWMADCFKKPGGFALVEQAAKIVAEKTSWSSDAVKSFRACMRKASKKAGLNDPLTIVKDNTGIDTKFVVRPATKRGRATKPTHIKINDQIKKALINEELDRSGLENIRDFVTAEIMYL